MKTQTLLMTLVILIAGPTFAESNLFAPSKALQTRCDRYENQDLSVSITCYENSDKYLQQLNDRRMEVLAHYPGLKGDGLETEMASVKAYRASTEANKNIFCSLKSAPNLMGGRGLALGNRECSLDQEFKLEKDLIQIKQLFDETARGFQEQ